MSNGVLLNIFFCSFSLSNSILNEIIECTYFEIVTCLVRRLQANRESRHRCCCRHFCYRPHTLTSCMIQYITAEYLFLIISIICSVMLHTHVSFRIFLFGAFKLSLLVLFQKNDEFRFFCSSTSVKMYLTRKRDSLCQQGEFEVPNSHEQNKLHLSHTQCCSFSLLTMSKRIECERPWFEINWMHFNNTYFFNSSSFQSMLQGQRIWALSVRYDRSTRYRVRQTHTNGLRTFYRVSNKNEIAKWVDSMCALNTHNRLKKTKKKVRS